MNPKRLILILLSALSLCSWGCTSLDTAQPYFEVVATIGTQRFISGHADRVAIAQETSKAIMTLSSGALLTPDQFHTSLLARLPKSQTVSDFVAIIDGVYALVYINFKDQPALMQTNINKIATIVAANAHL